MPTVYSCLRQQHPCLWSGFHQGRESPSVVVVVASSGEWIEVLIGFVPFLHPALGALINPEGRMFCCDTCVQQVIHLIAQGHTVVIESDYQSLLAFDIVFKRIDHFASVIGADRFLSHDHRVGFKHRVWITRIHQSQVVSSSVFRLYSKLCDGCHVMCLTVFILSVTDVEGCD